MAFNFRFQNKQTDWKQANCLHQNYKCVSLLTFGRSFVAERWLTETFKCESKFKKVHCNHTYIILINYVDLLCKCKLSKSNFFPKNGHKQHKHSILRSVFNNQRC